MGAISFAAALPARRATLLLVATTCLVLVSAGILRSFHAWTPRGPRFLGPFGSVLFVAVGGLLVLHIVQRRNGADLLRRGAGARGLTLAQIVPLLVAALGEKWFSGELLQRVYDWVDKKTSWPGLADSAFRGATGAGLLIASVLLLPVLRQARPRLARYVNSLRVREGLLLGATSLAVTAGAAVFLVLLDGGRFTMPAPRIAAAAGAAQIVRGAAEELFFRGLLQTTLVWVLVQAGLPDRRLVRGFAIVVVSLGFTLEHVDVQAPLAIALGAAAYVFTMSAMLGTLLEVSRNLYLPVIAHTAINLPLVGAVPLPVNATGAALMTPSGIGLFFFVALFTGLAVKHEWPRWTARLPDD